MAWEDYLNVQSFETFAAMFDADVAPFGVAIFWLKNKESYSLEPRLTRFGANFYDAIENPFPGSDVCTSPARERGHQGTKLGIRNSLGAFASTPF